MLRIVKGLVFLSLFAIFSAATAEEVSKEQIKGLDEQVQDIKKDVLAIASDLNLLEEKLIYPSNTQVSLFVSLDADDDTRLDAVEIELDGEVVAHHIYSFKELQALRAGGVQRIFTGNVRTGKHELRVSFIGEGYLGGEFHEQERYDFAKDVGPAFVEIGLAGQDVSFKTW
jgi:hypothetical protein